MAMSRPPLMLNITPARIEFHPDFLAEMFWLLLSSLRSHLSNGSLVRRAMEISDDEGCDAQTSIFLSRGAARRCVAEEISKRFFSEFKRSASTAGRPVV